MSQKLSAYIRLTWVDFPPIKTKVEIRREAAKKAWRSRKRVAAARAAAAASAEAGEDEGRRVA
jgi:hypothetical protein